MLQAISLVDVAVLELAGGWFASKRGLCVAACVLDVFLIFEDAKQSFGVSWPCASASLATGAIGEESRGRTVSCSLRFASYGILDI